MILGLGITLLAAWLAPDPASAGTYPHPWVIGHRGGSKFRPENTIPAYDFSLSNGATGVEFDIWLSSDGFPVLHHDLTLNRTTNGSGVVYTKTRDHLLTLDAGAWFGSGEWAGTPIPTLEQGLASAAGGGKILLDIKDLGYVATVVQTLQDEGFDPDDVWVWNRFGTGVEFEQLMPQAHVATAEGLMIDREWRIYERRQLGEDAIDLLFPFYDKAYIDLAHSYGVLVMGHTVLAPYFQQQIDLGVDIVVASNPTAFAPLLPGPDPQCVDGIDNDGDGLTDFPDDPSCWANEDDAEHADCSDGADNDGDGLTDYPEDPGCFSPFYTLENPACSDGIDNNDDGNVDFPADAGCFSLFDQGEQAACANGLDDDGDGAGDWPGDPGCLDVSSNNEHPECQDGLDNDGDGDVDMADWGCSDPGDASELYALPSCNDAIDNDSDGQIDFPDDPECLGFNDNSEAAECNDGLDNDEDGLSDFPDDPDCTSALDLGEQTECRDGLDNDGDGEVDLQDGACGSGADATEGIECNDGVDNDGDGLTDGLDAGCWGSGDLSELPDCSDGLDNDADGFTDHPADPTCAGPQGSFESIVAGVPALPGGKGILVAALVAALGLFGRRRLA